jgi:LemA protein
MTNVAVVVGVLVALAVLVPIVSYNRFVSQRQQIASAWATIDAELQRRHLLVPQLVDTVRAAAAHERELLVRLVVAEARAFEARTDPASLGAAEPELQAVLARLTALRESSPQLNSNANFLALQHQLAMIEDRIAAARRFYNTRVVAHNERVDAFPSNLVARNRGFEKAAYFGTDD